ncbi:MAG: alkaline phosphatase [Planctomycetota bacterium]|jgi:alkaline phosphatase
MLRTACLLSLSCLLALALPAVAAQPKNVIVMIGDGMGPVQVEAAGMYAGSDMSFEALPFQGMVTTYSANSAITDSAAAATALATGQKVNNGVISMAYPGDGSELTTALESYQATGRATGLVTTTYMTHATPAAYGAHEPSRGNLSQIANDYLTQTQPNILFGGGANGMSTGAATTAGYTVVTDHAGLVGLDTSTETYVSGQFGTYHLPYEYDQSPSVHLSEMTSVALDILDNDADGFFLMVEAGRIDHAGHENNIGRNIFETIEFSNTVQTVLDWAATRTDTLVVVTADHETGGLSITQDNGVGVLPTVSWGSGGHTAANVPVYAWGLNARNISGTVDNTFIHTLSMMSEPADFDGDGDVDDADIDTLRANLGGAPGTYDLDGSGTVDAADIDFILTDVVSSAVADFNLDRLINATDLAILAGSFGSAGGWADGNANGDAVVNATDLAILAANFGFDSPVSSQVPEPASVMLLSGSLLATLIRRRKSASGA